MHTSIAVGFTIHSKELYLLAMFPTPAISACHFSGLEGGVVDIAPLLAQMYQSILQSHNNKSKHTFRHANVEALLISFVILYVKRATKTKTQYESKKQNRKGKSRTRTIARTRTRARTRTMRKAQENDISAEPRLPSSPPPPLSATWPAASRRIRTVLGCYQYGPN